MTTGDTHPFIGDKSSKDGNDSDVGDYLKAAAELTAESEVLTSQNKQTCPDSNLNTQSVSDQETTNNNQTNSEQSFKDGNDYDVGDSVKSAGESTAENEVTESRNEQAFADSNFSTLSVSDQEIATDNRTNSDQSVCHSEESAVESTAIKEVTEFQNEEIFAESNSATDSVSDQEITTENQTDWEKNTTEWLDVLGNGLLMKKTISEGSGKRPVIENEVTVKYEAKMKGENEVVESNDDFSLVVRDGHHPPLFDIITMLMREGETCLVLSDAQYAYGAKGNPPSVPGNTTLEVKMQLLKVNDGPYSPGYDVEKQISFAEKKRALGNDFYKSKNFKNAELEYRKSLKCSRAGLEQKSFENGELESRWKEQCFHSYNNLTLTLMMLDSYDEALIACQAADQLQPHSPKTLYRKGKILCRLGKPEEGLACLKEAAELEPADRLICKEFNQQRIALHKQLQKEKEMYRKMLGQFGNNDKSTVMKKEQASWFYNNWARLLGGTLAIGVGLIGVYVAQKI